MALGDPLFLEALDYNAIEVRQLISACLSPGVVGSGDFLVSERGAGANMSVDVAAGLAVVEGTDNAGQGNYLVPNGATVNVAISAAPGSNSRIDVVYVKVRDNTEDSGGNDDSIFGVAAGTPAGSPVAPSIPDSALALAQVLIASGDTDIDANQITDVRARAVPATLPSTLQAGSGVTPGGGGSVAVVFDTPFLEPPAVVGQSIFNGTRVTKVSSVTATGFTIEVDDTSGVTIPSAPFHWIATAKTQ